MFTHHILKFIHLLIDTLFLPFLGYHEEPFNENEVPTSLPHPDFISCIIIYCRSELLASVAVLFLTFEESQDFLWLQSLTSQQCATVLLKAASLLARIFGLCGIRLITSSFI